MDKWHEPQTVALWIAVVGVVICLLVYALIRMSYLSFGQVTRADFRMSRMQVSHQKKLLETSILTQEKERLRVASDLHDSLIGKLVSIQIKNQLLSNDTTIDLLLRESISEARRISHDLSPPMIDYEPLDELLAEVIDPLKKSLGIRFYRDIRRDHELQAKEKIQLIRILQELLTNCYRHAHAKNVNVHLRCSETAIVLLVADDGRGFDINASAKGLGMYNVELRMQYLGGSYRVRSIPGKGTSVICAVHSSHTQPNS